jgi:HK97 family phage major capsid protein
MPSATDTVLDGYRAEIEERQTVIDGIIAGAQGRDLSSQELDTVARLTDRIGAVSGTVTQLGETSRIVTDARRRLDSLQREQAVARNPGSVRDDIEYRSVGEYICDYWRAGTGHEDARERLGLYMRAAAHQTTADNLGIIPTPVVGSVLNYIDSSRPIVATLGTLAVPGGRFTRPRVTQHTLVDAQSAEKAELASRKMLIDNLPVDMTTYGGYVNVSRQNIDWSTPNIMDLVVGDLGAQYAITTEQVAADEIGGAAVAGPVLPADADQADVSAALWTAAATAFSAVKGVGRLVVFVSPDMLGLVGPLFAPINPQNAQSTGFSAGAFGTGAMGAISGITVVMSAALPTGTMIVASTAAVELYEQRIGALSVTEPSVLGVQVAYAGYFAALVLVAGALVKITKA